MFLHDLIMESVIEREEMPYLMLELVIEREESALYDTQYIQSIGRCNAIFNPHLDRDKHAL